MHTFLLELHDAQDRLIQPLHHVIAPSVNVVLGDTGVGKFALLRSDPQRPLVTENCLVHCYVDGRDLFQFLIEDINEAYGESGQDQVNYSGRGVLAYLDRALIYPTGWPPPDGDPRLPVYGASILTNGDFETAAQPGAPPPGWTLPAVSGVTTTLAAGQGAEQDTSGQQTGTALVATTTQVVGETVVATQSGLFNQDAQHTSGATTWRVTAAVKPAATPHVAYGAGMRLHWFDSHGNELGAGGDQATVADVWNALEAEITAPPEANQYRLDLWVTGSVTARFDLVTLAIRYTDALPQYPAQPDPNNVQYGPNLLDDPDPYNLPNHWAHDTSAYIQGFVASGFAGGVDVIAGAGQGTGVIVWYGLEIPTRTVPTVTGLAAHRDLPVTPGYGYHGSLMVANYDRFAVDPLPPGTPDRVCRRQFYSASGDPLGPAVDTNGVCPTISDQTRPTVPTLDLPTMVAPAGAAYLRYELWAPAGVYHPVWLAMSLKQGTLVQTTDDAPPGTWRAYRNQRIPDIIRDVITTTAQRRGGDWPIAVGNLAYDQDYDVVDGVLIPKDQRTVIYRFDPVGQALLGLTKGAGDLTMQGLTVNYAVELGTDVSRRVTFREGLDLITVPKEHSSRDAKSRLIVEGQGEGVNAVTVEVTDPALVAKYGVREGFLDRKSVPALLDLHKEGRAALTDLDTVATKITVTVATNRFYPGVDYGLGDGVGLAVPHLHLYDTYRVVGLTLTPDANGGLPQVQLDLDAAAYDLFVRVAQSQQQTAQSVTAAQRLPQGNVSLYQVAGEDSLDAQHPYELRFYMPSTPLWTNQVRLSFQGRPFRTTVQIGATAINTGLNATLQVQSAKNPAVAERTDAAGAIDVTLRDGGGGTLDVPAHTHAFTELAHQHAVILPAHEHPVTVPVQYGIYESTSPAGLAVQVNDIPLDPVAFGYADQGGDDLEIGRFIRRGWNTVTFSSTQLGRVTAQIVIQCYLESQVAPTL